MSFLAPLFWLGAAAVALPVLFHLIRRTTKEQTVFSSLMFLLPSPPRLTRRSRLEHLLLLLLRCAILCLLAAGFARPFIKKAMSSTAQNGPGKKRLVLLDTSASMRRSDLWNDAKQRVQRIASQSGPADELAVYTFDRTLTPLVGFEQWKSSATGDRVGLVKQRLAETSPSWMGTAQSSSGVSLANFSYSRQ
jgi:hypothetical protein